ncbi:MULTISPECIES: adenosylcobinamide amidohydrolase [Roseobacteraceae]|uniref:Adenosylcobinamide amidohydrolase n=1 Tax=Pseudosulfitobacter pseudonitzschiae TaxID=1402135 RepID=A0A221JYV0_9RHOB|nr:MULTISPECIES: adenosylcobinamide amidohydrolase [Roseobacteraceae]ASM71810.1 adenosylcobinamide amidohydrolase [Pseudosulfitobacter pseudonitzschiae]
MTAPLILERPWLRFDLGGPHQVLSWALNRPGFVTADAISWREVRNADLTPELDVPDWLTDQLAARGTPQDVCFLTSRDIRAVTEHTTTAGTATARAVATVGLSNAEHIGTRADRSGKDWGTINVAVQTGLALAQPALIEMMAIAAQARTVAVMQVNHQLPTGRATGTGTDCIAVAAPRGDVAFAGMHTDLGEAVGRAVYTAVLEGAQTWMQTVRRAEVL